MGKLKNCITENWQDLIAVILVSISIVCILLDIVQVFSISAFYIPYIVALPTTLAVVLKLFCKREGKTEDEKIIYYALGLAIVEYLILVLLDEMLFPSKFKISIYMITALYMLIHSKIEGKKTIVAKGKDNQQEWKKKTFSLYYINTEKVYEIAMLLNNRIVASGTSKNESESTIDKQTNIGM